jgi:hypothetical protein
MKYVGTYLMSDGNSEKMHERITSLEMNHRGVINRIESVEASVGALASKMDKVLDFVQEARVKQLPPIQTIIVTTVATLTLMSMVVGGIYWMVDTRVGNGVMRANYFLGQMADGPDNIWVKLHDLDYRVRKIESTQQPAQR